MVVVPVSIDGAGPFNLVLDTGATNTLIDRDLAKQLSLPRVGEKEERGLQTTMRLPIVHSQSISIAGGIVRDLDVSVLPRDNGLPANVRGILGEDFDLLIDNRHHVIQLQLGSGPMSDMFEGERLPVRLEGTIDGQYVKRRLIVSGGAFELGNKAISLLLDSGVNYLYFFGGAESLGTRASKVEFAQATASSSSNIISGYSTRIPELRLGNKKMSNVMALAQPRTARMDTDGLLPTSVFHSIFISHSQKFVISTRL